MNDLNPNRTAAGVLAGVTLLAGGIESAVAGAITSSQEWFWQSTGYSEVNRSAPGSTALSAAAPAGSKVSLPKYTGTGTLTGIFIDFGPKTGSSGAYQVVSYNPGSATSGSATFTVSSTGLRIGVDAFGATEEVQAAITDAVAMLTPTGGNPGSDVRSVANIDNVITFTLTIPAASYSNFYGSGTFDVSQTLSITGLLTVTQTPDFSGAFTAYGGMSASWEGYATVRYEFTNDVPEPAGLALLGIGLAGLRATRRPKGRSAG